MIKKLIFKGTSLTENFFNILFIITTAACLLAVVIESYDLKIVFKPLPLLVLTLLYIYKVDKINYWILASLILSVISDFIFTIENLFIEGLILFTVVQLILIKVIYTYFKKRIDRTIYLYFTIFVLCFFLIFTLLFENTKSGIHYYFIFLYGLTTSLLAAVSFANYLHKINTSNLMLFLGVFLNVLSSCILGIDLFGESSLFYNFTALLLYFISHYIIYYVLILKNK